MMYCVKNVPLISKAKNAVDLAFKQQHLAEAFGAQIGIDPPWCDDSAPTTIAQEVMGLLDEELIEVCIGTDLLAIDHASLIAEFFSNFDCAASKSWMVILFLVTRSEYCSKNSFELGLKISHGGLATITSNPPRSPFRISSNW